MRWWRLWGSLTAWATEPCGVHARQGCERKVSHCDLVTPHVKLISFFLKLKVNTSNSCMPTYDKSFKGCLSSAAWSSTAGGLYKRAGLTPRSPSTWPSLLRLECSKAYCALTCVRQILRYCDRCEFRCNFYHQRW
ncbi:hypothetical protein COO60DRAFT_352751 [Scenedesmus sp. NREL 46B-D3]|nr:hypothetical protein COO60DRAFT_352751 [Scenedesmus sp. NREL 46B-D3]